MRILNEGDAEKLGTLGPPSASRARRARRARRACPRAEVIACVTACLDPKPMEAKQLEQQPRDMPMFLLVRAGGLRAETSLAPGRPGVLRNFPACKVS